jgi:hypothetical protein
MSYLPFRVVFVQNVQIIVSKVIFYLFHEVVLNYYLLLLQLCFKMLPGMISFVVFSIV